jgi:hypothetical protein
MSGYGGMSTSSSSNRSNSGGQFGQNVWKGQGNALKDLYSAAGGFFGSQQNMMPWAQGFAQQAGNSAMPAYQGMLNGGAYSGVDSAAIQKSLQDSLGQPSNMQTINNMIMGGAGNNYADAMRSVYQTDANRAQQNMLNNIESRTSSVGMPGSSREAIAKGIGMTDINRNLQSNLADVGYKTFDADLNRKLSIAQQADQATLSRQQMLNDLLAGKQNAMSGGLGMMPQFGSFGMNAAGSPFQQWGQLLGAPTVLGSGSNFGQSMGNSSGFGMQGGGGMSVICTELNRQGILSDELYKADGIWFDSFKLDNLDVVSGYHYWAIPVVNVMKKSKLVTKFISLVAIPWAEDMAYQVGKRKSGNLFGRFVMNIGIPICRAIGRAKLEVDYVC